MQRFEIKGEEHEVRLDFKAIQHLNSLYQGNGYGLIQRALSGDIDTYIEIINAGLFHTGKGFKKSDVAKEVEAAVMEERLDMFDINKTCYAVVSENFFYKKILEKVILKDPSARKQIESLMK